MNSGSLENKIKIVPISELLDMDFFIPKYQRGYRWEKLQVEELLNDILRFIEQGQRGFYCLQPLVIKRSTIKDNISEIKDIKEYLDTIKEDSDLVGSLLSELKRHTRWEVIDGQQRLTTLFIILTELRKGKKPYNLEYERKGSGKFLEQIYTSNSEGKENIDFLHMIQARNVIRTWLDKHSSIREILLTVILDQVQFIWYESVGEDPIEVFTRLNIGKISLTNAELIKAMILNSSNYTGLTENLIRSKQLQIAAKWDEIEYTLQNDEIWLFLNDAKSIEFTRIDYLFNIIYENDLLHLNLDEKEYDACIGNDRYSVYRYFAKVIQIRENNEIVNTLDSVWNKITTLYDTLIEWYNDSLFYHYIGYRIWTKEDNKDNKIDRRKFIAEQYEKWIATDKNKFLEEHLIKDIKNAIDCNRDELNTLHFENNKSKIRKILLLHNIQTIINQQGVQTEKYKQHVFYKFPFHLFKKEIWNVEHIDSATTNDLEKTKDKKAWLRAAIATGKVSYQDVEDILNTPDKNSMEGFEDIYNKVMSSFPSDDLLKEQNEEDDNERMHIWNLALLDEKTNKSYHNSIFSVKRAFVIYKEQGTHCFLSSNGKVEFDDDKCIAFVPICTKQAFMKYYTADANALLAWTKTDAKAYLGDIQDKLTNFLK